MDTFTYYNIHDIIRIENLILVYITLKKKKTLRDQSTVKKHTMSIVGDNPLR